MCTVSPTETPSFSARGMSMAHSLSLSGMRPDWTIAVLIRSVADQSVAFFVTLPLLKNASAL